MSEAWATFSGWVMGMPADRAVGLVVTAAVLLMAAHRGLILTGKGLWHAGAFVRRRLTPVPVVLATEVQLLADAIREGGDRREGGYMACGRVVVTPAGAVWLAKGLTGGKIEGRDVTGCYSPEELKAVRAAVADRVLHFAARDREQAALDREKTRHEAIGMPAPPAADFPVLGGGGPRRKTA